MNNILEKKNQLFTNKSFKHREIPYETVKECIERIPNKMHKALFAFQYATGCRQKELLYVENSHFDYNPPLLWLSVYTVKNPDHPNRPFAINKEKESWLYEAIMPWVEFKKKQEKEMLFPPEELAPYSKKDPEKPALRAIRRLTKRYFGVRITNHSLRHSRVTYFFRHNKNLNDSRAMRLFGWKDRKAIARYDHLRREDVKDVFE